MIRIVFFAALREQLNCSELHIPLGDLTNISELKAHLVKQNPHFSNAFNNTSLLCALNHQMVSGHNDLIKAGDEIAFFPPVTGG